MILYVLSVILLFLFILLTFNLFRKMKTAEKILGVFLFCNANIILTLEIASLFQVLSKTGFVLLIQIVINTVAYWMNSYFQIGFPRFLVSNIKNEIKTSLVSVKKNIGIVIFFGLIFITYLFLAYIQIRFPQNTTDNLINHLSRIGHWLQQGSLRTYDGFNMIGTSYPYNNSLLMLWAVVFLRSDILVGFVQLVSAVLISITIYNLGIELGFTKKGSFFISLFFLTFPVVLFESITAQNDLIAAAFMIISFYFLIRFMHGTSRTELVLSILSFALATGTNQYTLFALPGYVSLYVLMLTKQRASLRILLIQSVFYALSFFILLGSYAYLQNWMVFGNPIGGSAIINSVFTKKNSIISINRGKRKETETY